MKASRPALLALALLLFSGAAAVADPPRPAATGLARSAQMRRFALVVGSNGGGSERLRYAGSDARSFASLMTELGGVLPPDLILLVDPGLPALEGALREIRDSAAAASSNFRSEFIFYYSGHSDETGLLLDGAKFGYPELRSGLEAVNADLRVAILDSCSSGAMTRAKGGSARPAFVFDESSDMRGHAYITSSSAAESAQESDRLGGSFFTHYLISGLRGAADSLGQGRVTLNEAYAYAFKETLASTEQTRFGAQHPAYEINLTGTGDLVLTDLRASTAGLFLAEDVEGRVFIRDAKGILAVELAKDRGKRVEIGIAPGAYGVILDSGSARYGADLRIAKGSFALLSASDLKELKASPTAARGGPLLAPEALAGIAAPLLAFQFLPDFGKAFFTSGQDRTFAINALVGSARQLRGFEVAGLVNSESLGATGGQIGGIANVVLGPSLGFQAAGVVNYSGGDMGWFNIAGLANIVGGRSVGAQIAGLVNLSQSGRVLYAGGESRGFVGEIPSATAEANLGFQVAGLANWASSPFAGVTLAGILNRAANFDGFQASLINRASRLRGLQLGLVNSSAAHYGAQLGLVNVSGEVRGAQLGLVNVADRIYGPSLGLISIERGGILAFEATGGVDGSAETAIKVGTRHSYSIASVGTNSLLSPKEWNLALGLGFRFGLGSFFIDGDARWRLSSGEGGSPSSILGGSRVAVLRLLLGERHDSPLALVGGASVELRLPGLSAEADGSPTTSFGWTPRFVFGIQL